MRDVAICVLSFNGRDVLRECLQALRAQRGIYTFEIVVTDNGSTDGTAEMVRSEFPEARLIVNEKNQAFTRPFNRMARETTSRYLFFVSNDVRVETNTLQRLFEILEKEERTGAAIPQSVKPDGSLERVAKREFDLRTALAEWTFLGRLARPKAPEPYDLTRAQSVEVGQDSCILLRRAAFEGRPIFDERLGLYYTEDDLCVRLRRSGWTVRYEPEAQVMHLYQYTMRRVKPLKHKWLYTRDMLTYSRKHLGRARASLLLTPLVLVTFAFRLPKWIWQRRARR